MNEATTITRHYTVAQTAELAGRTEKAMRKLIERDRKLDAADRLGPNFVRLHGRLVVSEPDLAAWLAAGTDPAA